MAGKIDVSRQLFDRSNPSADTILTQDLAVDYAKQPDSQLLTQATNGVLNQSGTNAVTYTDTTPTVPELYPKLADAIQQVAVNRFAPATAICMHPRRWAWTTAALDSQTRPLAVPEAGGAMKRHRRLRPGDGRGCGRSDAGPAGVLGRKYPDERWDQHQRGQDHRGPVLRRPALRGSRGPNATVYQEVLSGNLQVRLMVWG